MEIYEFGTFRFEVAQRQLWSGSQIIPLQPKVADLLTLFLQKNGELLSRKEIMAAIWKDTFVEETNLRFCIHSLRKSLGPKPDKKDYIETVPKRGYRFAAEVKKESADDENSLGRYKILQKIGVGGMGEIFLANDPQLERNVALKILLPEIAKDDDFIKRFKLEAKAVSALNHPNIVTVFDVGEARGKFFIAYEFIEGETIREKITRNKLNVSASINIAEQIANALFVAHQADIVHRDIKPENIMIREDGYVKILDFGLAKRSSFSSTNDDETLEWVKTQKGTIMGSVQYMSPEQSRGVETDPRTDIWSLGVCLFEMLTGQNPFEGETISDSVASILHFEPASIDRYLQGFPAGLREIIEKSLQKDLTKRYQNIKTLAEDLNNVRRHLTEAVLTKRIIFDGPQEKTVEFQTRITDGQNPGYQNNKSLDSAPEVITEISPDRKLKTWPRKIILIPFTALLGFFLLGGYFFYRTGGIPDTHTIFRQNKITRLTDDGKSNKATISDDKKWLAFVRENKGKQNLIVREIASGKEKELETTSTGEILQPTFEPKDSEINKVYFVIKEGASGDLYSYTFKDLEKSYFRKEKLLTNVDSRISFAPDGRKFAFVRQNPNEGGSSILISSTGTWDNFGPVEKINSRNTKFSEFIDVSWQSTGEQLTIMGLIDEGFEKTLQAQTFGEGHVYVEANGKVKWAANGSYFSMSRLFGDGWINFQQSHFLRDKALIINSGIYKLDSFDSNKDGKTLTIDVKENFSSLWSLDSLKKEKKQILNEKDKIDPRSIISQMPDGKILLTKTENTHPQEFMFSWMDENGRTDIPGDKISQIISTNPDGTEERVIFQCKNQCSEPRATRDGKYILFVNHGIFRINRDGSNPLQLTGETNSDQEFQIMADNRTIIFTRFDKEKKTSKLLKISIDGGEALPLFSENDSKTTIWNPVIFEQGKSLAYLSKEFEQAASSYKTKLKVVSLSENGESQPAFERYFEANKFKISPDNKWIYYQNQNGLFRLSVKSESTETKPEQVLTPESGWIGDFIWLEDNETILYLLNWEKSDVFLIEDVE